MAETMGICFGVERALNLGEKALAQNQGPLSSLGPIIHNPQVVEDLSRRGLAVASEISEVQGTVMFRSHGVPLETQKEAEARGLKIIDATCPLVKVPQNFARKLSQAGYFVIIVGDKNHPEVTGVKSYVQNGEYAVIKDAEGLQDIPSREKVGVICQTTLKRSVFEEVVEKCRERFGEVKVHNTICSATKDRQEAAYKLSEQVDCVVVIGGRNSSNTQKLYDICKTVAGDAHLIETEDEIQAEWFQGKETVGITAGASTPQTVITKVRDRVAKLAPGAVEGH